MYEKRSAANMLRAVGMHPKYKGYAYVLCILEKTGMEPERLYGSAGEMYRLVEEKFGIKRAAMERCIRFAIQRTWDTGNDKHAHNNGVPRSDDGGPVLRAGRTQSLII